MEKCAPSQNTIMQTHIVYASWDFAAISIVMPKVIYIRSNNPYTFLYGNVLI